uniref:Uncharacterized protein n=1 Tax=Timema bartmani TaxID=61472 RepID=A0A7R9ENF9_9NEOP|nr:unnamed protein product [Timema bartmani]
MDSSRRDEQTFYAGRFTRAPQREGRAGVRCLGLMTLKRRLPYKRGSGAAVRDYSYLHFSPLSVPVFASVDVRGIHLLHDRCQNIPMTERTLDWLKRAYYRSNETR